MNQRLYHKEFNRKDCEEKEFRQTLDSADKKLMAAGSCGHSSGKEPAYGVDRGKDKMPEQENILTRIVLATKERVRKRKENLSLKEIKAELYEDGQLKRFHNRPSFAFEAALRKEGMSFICEVKKASPSKGIIAGDFPYLTIAREYEEAGADAISVLTEPDFFLGRDEYLSEISRAVSIPILRKDFIIDEYQIYEAKRIGADAILLICSLLTQEQLRDYLLLAGQLGLSALVEAHTGDEIRMALISGAGIIGVNNRNLKTFAVDLMTSIELRKLVPAHVVFVAESGIHRAEDIRLLKEAGTDAVLIGEALMKSGSKKQLLSELRGNPEAISEF